MKTKYDYKHDQKYYKKFNNFRVKVKKTKINWKDKFKLREQNLH